MSKSYLSEMEYVSDCCAVPPRSNGDSDTSDIGICPECGDHCEYVDMSEDDTQELTDDQKMYYYEIAERIKRLSNQSNYKI
jgi:transcription initiation factor IIE alpha subunit